MLLLLATACTTLQILPRLVLSAWTLEYCAALASCCLYCLRWPAAACTACAGQLLPVLPALASCCLYCLRRSRQHGSASAQAHGERRLLLSLLLLLGQQRSQLALQVQLRGRGEGQAA
jgi:hypothetical protein